jgi:hypothetical protein
MLIDGADPGGHDHSSFKRSIKSVYEYLSNIGKSGSTKVLVIQGGTHLQKFYEKSPMYAGCLKEAIQNSGYNLSMELEGNNPNQHFYYMSHAKRLIVSTGGYSQLWARWFRKEEGVLIRRVF